MNIWCRHCHQNWATSPTAPSDSDVIVATKSASLTAPDNTNSYNRCHHLQPQVILMSLLPPKVHHLQLQTILIVTIIATKRTAPTAPNNTDTYQRCHQAILIIIIVDTKSTSPTAPDNTDNHHRCHQTYVTYSSRQYRYYRCHQNYSCATTPHNTDISIFLWRIH